LLSCELIAVKSTWKVICVGIETEILTLYASIYLKLTKWIFCWISLLIFPFISCFQQMQLILFIKRRVSIPTSICIGIDRCMSLPRNGTDFPLTKKQRWSKIIAPFWRVRILTNKVFECIRISRRTQFLAVFQKSIYNKLLCFQKFLKCKIYNQTNKITKFNYNI